MLLPIMLPTKRSFSPFLAAATVVTSSGKEVPRATIVRENLEENKKWIDPKVYNDCKKN